MENKELHNEIKINKYKHNNHNHNTNLVKLYWIYLRWMGNNKKRKREKIKY